MNRPEMNRVIAAMRLVQENADLIQVFMATENEEVELSTKEIVQGFETAIQYINDEWHWCFYCGEVIDPMDTKVHETDGLMFHSPCFDITLKRLGFTFVPAGEMN